MMHLVTNRRCGLARQVDLAGAAHLVLAAGVVHLDPQTAVFEAMVEGWARQQRSRLLAEGTVGKRVRLVRRFAEFTSEYPWSWQPGEVEEFSGSLRGDARAPSTVRAYQQALRLFCDFAADPRYGWAAECEQRFGSYPVQVCHEWNTAAHVADFEGAPGRRPFTRQELQEFFDFADAQVGRIGAGGRKGALAAFRDAVCFKVIYAWGLRRREAVMLDAGDWHPSPAAPAFGNLGSVHVRFGKAMRGSAPRRRTVLSVFGWAVEAVEQYFAEVRPLSEPGPHPAMWVSERGGRIAARTLNDRFAAYRAELGFPEVLDLHALRHSYVTHLAEDGFPEKFVSEQVGHAYVSTTALYTSVSDDFKNRVLARALEPAFGAAGAGSGR
jgi:integrase/recombinase XerC